MYIIADSGSTKCDWMCVEGASIQTLRTQGINAALHTPKEVMHSLEELPQTLKPSRVVFYGAGCGEHFPAATQTLHNTLSQHFNTCNIELYSDLLGAARALFGRKAGITCILGTGSNSCYYDGEHIVHNVPPLGYILGDEGSGAALGRKLLNGLLKGTLGEELTSVFYATHKLNYEEVIRRVYREPQANRFLASLVPFIYQHIETQGIRTLVHNAFREFAERNLQHYPHAEVAFTGGVAAALETELRAVMIEQGYRVGRITASPAAGLIEYHEGK
ncbi:MAG: ATPase [Alistipes sp.]